MYFVFILLAKRDGLSFASLARYFAFLSSSFMLTLSFWTSALIACVKFGYTSRGFKGLVSSLRTCGCGSAFSD